MKRKTVKNHSMRRMKRKTFRKKRKSTNKNGGDKNVSVENVSVKEFPNAVDSKRRYDYAGYLSGVNFYNMTDIDEIVKLKDEIIKKSFYENDNHYFKNIDEELKTVINQMNTSSNTNKWIECKNNCQNYCIQMMSYEINSTAYMLRLLSNSVIGDTDNNKIAYIIEKDTKTNIEKDFAYPKTQFNEELHRTM